MVDKINGTGPKGYNRVTLYNEKTKKSETFFVPVGKKLTINDTTYDIDRTKNKELVIVNRKNSKDDNFFKFSSVALDAMDVNNDKKIDKKDTSHSIGKDANNDKMLPKGHFVDMIDPTTYDANVYEGDGYVNFCKEHMGEKSFKMSLD